MGLWQGGGREAWEGVVGASSAAVMRGREACRARSPPLLPLRRHAQLHRAADGEGDFGGTGCRHRVVRKIAQRDARRLLVHRSAIVESRKACSTIAAASSSRRCSGQRFVPCESRPSGHSRMRVIGETACTTSYTLSSSGVRVSTDPPCSPRCERTSPARLSCWKIFARYPSGTPSHRLRPEHAQHQHRRVDRAEAAGGGARDRRDDALGVSRRQQRALTGPARHGRRAGRRRRRRAPEPRPLDHT
jgi:hypothetical protein